MPGRHLRPECQKGDISERTAVKKPAAKVHCKMIKAALLDMDGTIYDTERLSTEGWTYASSAIMGKPLSVEKINAFHGRNIEDNHRLFASWYGEDAPYYEIRRLRKDYIDQKIREEGVPVKPGLYELLDTLKEKGIRICVATGTARPTAEPYWEQTGVAPYLYTSICGDEVSTSKPDPSIFLKAAEKCGCAPEECVIFEDSPNGLKAGHAAGSRLFLIPDTDPVTEEMLELADAVFDTLADAAAVIRTWPDAAF